MISVRECLDRPQVLSTDRHLMQGYLDLSGVAWDAQREVLSGTSKIVGGDPYRVSLALNGHVATAIRCHGGKIAARLLPPVDGVVEFLLEGPENGSVDWSVSFAAE